MSPPGSGTSPDGTISAAGGDSATDAYNWFNPSNGSFNPVPNAPADTYSDSLNYTLLGN